MSSVNHVVSNVKMICESLLIRVRVRTTTLQWLPDLISTRSEENRRRENKHWQSCFKCRQIAKINFENFSIENNWRQKMRFEFFSQSAFSREATRNAHEWQPISLIDSNLARGQVSSIRSNWKHAHSRWRRIDSERKRGRQTLWRKLAAFSRNHIRLACNYNVGNASRKAVIKRWKACHGTMGDTSIAIRTRTVISK